MRYVKIKAKTYNEAMMKLKMEHGDDAIPISHKYVKEGGCSTRSSSPGSWLSSPPRYRNVNPGPGRRRLQKARLISRWETTTY